MSENWLLYTYKDEGDIVPEEFPSFAAAIREAKVKYHVLREDLTGIEIRKEFVLPEWLEEQIRYDREMLDYRMRDPRA